MTYQRAAAARHARRGYPRRRDPSSTQRERTGLVMRELLDRVHRYVAGDESDSSPLWNNLVSNGAVLADGLEEHGYPNLASDLRTHLQKFFAPAIGDPDGWWRDWKRVHARIHQVTREIASGAEDEIRDPNSSGQGYAPAHKENAFHALLLRNGFAYSHSTRVTLRAGSTIHHTYFRLIDAARTVSVWRDTRGGDSWCSSKIGSARQTCGDDGGVLERHLKQVRRARKKGS